MNVAVVVAGGLVETLQTAPLLGALAAGGAGGIVLCTPPSARDLAGALVGVAEMLPMRTLGGQSGLAGGVVALRRHRVEAVLVCSSRPRDRVLAYAAGCANRLGPTGGGLSLLLTVRVADDRQGNRAGTWLRLAGALGTAGAADGPALNPGEGARHRARALLMGRGLEDGRPLLALVPGMTRDTGTTDPAARRWDPERYAHLANQLSSRHGAGVVVLGTEEDRDLVDRFLLDVAAPALDLSGLLTVLEMAAVAERCDLLVAGDSPALHLAAGVGTPTVGLFAPSDGRRRGPHGPDHRVLQAIADGDAGPTMSRIRVDDVLAAIESRLG